MAIDSLTSAIRIIANWTATDTLTGTDYTGTSNSSTINKSVSLGTAAANAAANGSDELVSYIVSLAGAASTTLDLTSIANILGVTTSFARLKGVVIRLLSTTDDTTNGTAASSITVGNAATNILTLFMDADADTFTIKNGECIAWFSPTAAGITVDSTNKSLKILNNDASVTAKIQVTFVGGTT